MTATTTTLGPPAAGSPEAKMNVEAAIHAKLEAIAARHEERVLEGIADIISKFDQPDRTGIPQIVNSNGETVVRTSRAWDSSPDRMRIPEPERKYRTFDGDLWNLQWLRAIQAGNYAGRVEAEAHLERIYPDLYRADTLEGAADASGGFAAGTGGVLLPRPLETLVAIALAKVAKFARWARTYTMTAQEHNIPTAGAATAYMQGEATSPLTGGEPALAQVPLICHDAIGKLILGRNLLDDQAANVVPIFVELMGDALAELEDAEFLKDGTGSAPHVTKLAATGFTETTSGILSATNLFAMYRLVPQRYRENAMWLVNATVLGLLSNIRDGMGRPFYQSLLDPPMPIDDSVTGARINGAVGFLLGKPVH